MKLAQSANVGAWFLIVMNLLMAFGSVWIFIRMSPAIELIIAQNEVSLESCEEMMASLLLAGASNEDDAAAMAVFRNALDKAKNNITEKEESAVIDTISRHYGLAFQGDGESFNRTVTAIADLRKINRAAMYKADARARKLGNAGAWWVVFMATISFTIGMIYLRSMRKNLSEPMQEIDTVLTSYREGDRMRRCTMKNPSRGIRKIFGNVNELLDTNSACWNKDI